MTCVGGVRGGGFIPVSPLCSRYRISPSATTAAGWWSARSEALPTCSPSTPTEASPVSGPTCPHGWSIAWAASRRARGWRRSNRSWRPSREDAVAPCLACPAAPLAHLSMVNPLSSFLSILRIIMRSCRYCAKICDVCRYCRKELGWKHFGKTVLLLVALVNHAITGVLIISPQNWKVGGL